MTPRARLAHLAVGFDSHAIRLGTPRDTAGHWRTFFLVRASRDMSANHDCAVVTPWLRFARVSRMSVPVVWPPTSKLGPMCSRASARSPERNRVYPYLTAPLRRTGPNPAARGDVSSRRCSNRRSKVKSHGESRCARGRLLRSARAIPPRGRRGVEPKPFRSAEFRAPTARTTGVERFSADKST